MQGILTNNTTKFTLYLDNLEVNSDNSMYAKVLINTKGLDDGEYTLKLYTDRNNLIVEDIVKIGETKTEKMEYKIEKKFTQYVRK